MKTKSASTEELKALYESFVRLKKPVKQTEVKPTLPKKKK